MHTLGNDARPKAWDRAPQRGAGARGGAIPKEVKRDVGEPGKRSARSLRAWRWYSGRPVPSDHRKRIPLIEAVDRIKVLYEERSAFA